MKTGILNLSLVLLLSVTSGLKGQQPGQVARQSLLPDDDLKFLGELTATVIDSSRIIPGQKIAGTIGPNNTGGTLIRPGGRDCYPAFWIRDYAMSLESGFITAAEQRHMLILTASTQCDKAWITAGGSLVPYGSIADHVRIDDGLPVYFPGTLDFLDQGNKKFGMVPPYDDQFFFIHMAWYYVKNASDKEILDMNIRNKTLAVRLEEAFAAAPSRPDNNIVRTSADFRGVDFGFRDVITITGDLCMTSILKCRAAIELAELFRDTGRDDLWLKYSAIGKELRQAIPVLFQEPAGLLRASTGKSSQPDVWSTALAVWLGILEGDQANSASHALAGAYVRQEIAYSGNIRHVPLSGDYNRKTSWEFSLARKNTYQNGAYWGTATGWVCYAISLTDPALARQLAGEYIRDLKENDFRKGGGKGAPWECFHPSGFRQNPVYMTTVSCPYIVFRTLK
jgi:hypothetical protein